MTSWNGCPFPSEFSYQFHGTFSFPKGQKTPPFFVVHPAFEIGLYFHIRTSSPRFFFLISEKDHWSRFPKWPWSSNHKERIWFVTRLLIASNYRAHAWPPWDDGVTLFEDLIPKAKVPCSRVVILKYWLQPDLLIGLIVLIRLSGFRWWRRIGGEGCRILTVMHPKNAKNRSSSIARFGVVGYHRPSLRQVQRPDIDGWQQNPVWRGQEGKVAPTVKPNS